jgi:hypothetical protein
MSKLSARRYRRGHDMMMILRVGVGERRVTFPTLYRVCLMSVSSYVEILLDLRSFSATTDALSLAHSLARLTPTECEREASCERAPDRALTLLPINRAQTYRRR